MRRFGLVVCVLFAPFYVFLSSAWAQDYNVMRGTENHDWTEGAHPVDPPCGKPKPCLKDISGTKRPDKLYSRAGWDRVRLHGGDDVFYGGPGMDQAYGDEGDDRLMGQTGHDHLWGGEGADIVNTADGQDEPGHFEEVHGDGTGFDDPGDVCTVDEDPHDGVIVNNCETLVIKDIGIPGDSLVAPNMGALQDGRGTLMAPGTYHF